MKMKKKGIIICFFGAIVFIFLLVGLWVYGQRTAETFLLDTYKEATEILYHEEFSNGREIIFFVDENGYISCALLKKELVGFKTLRISGKLLLYNSGYLCSFYDDGNERFWIDWGIITDGSLENVWADSKEMKIVECEPYSYRICWLIGTGEEPQSHIVG